MIFYTSDLHFYHKNVIDYCSRPFETVEQMNETIVENWNSVVSPDDTVYVLGDVFFRLSATTELFLDRMNGTKHLIVGNHDMWYIKKPRFSGLFTGMNYRLVIEDEGRMVVLSHCPLTEWEGMNEGWYHVYGHVHNNLSELAVEMSSKKNAFNAGVDVNDFTPQTLAQLIERNNANAQNNSV